MANEAQFPFAPGASNNVLITVAATTATVALPVGSGDVLELTNDGSVAVFVSIGTSAITATIPLNGGAAGSYPILAGQSKCVTMPRTNHPTHIATISGTASQPLYVSRGTGQS